jgi:CRP-like cAMP-binding protein
MLPPRAPASSSGRPLPLRNQLLAQLPAEDLRRLVPFLEHVTVAPRQALQRTGDSVRYVYFPNSGVYSVLTILSSGEMIESCAVGDEGMIGVEAFIEAMPRALSDAVLQVSEPGATAERLPVVAFRRELERHGALHAKVCWYLGTVLAVLLQSTACHAAHSLPQRCCRWLLETEERARTSRFRVTQELLASILGARRPTVTLITRDLQTAGLLEYTRGEVTIVDRDGLEQRSCECYRAVQRWRTGRASRDGNP